MKFKQLHELVNEGKTDAEFEKDRQATNDHIKKMIDYKGPFHPNTVKNAEKVTAGKPFTPEMMETMKDMSDQPRRDFDLWWKMVEAPNHKFPSDAVHDACKNCAMNAWFAAMEQFY